MRLIQALNSILIFFFAKTSNSKFCRTREENFKKEERDRRNKVLSGAPSVLSPTKCANLAELNI